MTVVVIPHEHAELELCAELARYKVGQLWAPARIIGKFEGYWSCL
ncbi:MAG TPA: hypothetical protein VNO30_44180 [Kofleriaceae bacterium]|nr:hypothetical protein [Kofleriaceae bacterium]